jgi:hypothetical protein
MMAQSAGDAALRTDALAPWAYPLSSLNTGSLSGANNVSYTVSATSPSTAYNAAQLIHNPTN